MAVEHGKQCVSHKPAREPKRWCEVVINGTHACSNYARKGETKCSVHGEPIVRQVLQPQLRTLTAKPLNDPVSLAHHESAISERLLEEWEAQVDVSKQKIDPVTHWFEFGGGRPSLVVVLPKEQAHDIEISGKIPVQPEDDDANVQMDIDVIDW